MTPPFRDVLFAVLFLGHFGATIVLAIMWLTNAVTHRDWNTYALSLTARPVLLGHAFELTAGVVPHRLRAIQFRNGPR